MMKPNPIEQGYTNYLEAHNIRKPYSKTKPFPNIKIDGELSWTEYNILFRYSLKYNLPSMFAGIKKLIREEGAREQDENRDS